MKKKIIVGSVVGVLLLGGALGVSAVSEPKVASSNDLITMDKAAEIATKKVDGVVESINLEKEKGRLVYEVDFDGPYGDDDDDIEVYVDAVSGEVVKVKNDDKNVSGTVKQTKSEQGTQKTASSKIITQEEAIAIATKDTPGKVIEVEYDDGEYEIEIHTDTHDVDFEIDARTGTILEKDVDRLDDDDRYDD
ncbi:PepSY domain-containing protein [Robertmurraya massiliosenegalensis]|uniref:PepSY domain-containing protein n=1 Tax=Robertmurraya massiliosenegalensis TaxID=1287657 RepID=UPI000314C9FB|nr:PepSY domain-containing protein [Robertmurraya massiliosenegalensis]